uniref:Uncharacterized protein n=1 Tax=Kalanchoe fedtschenkoi TaxID=63787 RepID=A0A7N0UFG2_KALFE
MEVQIVTEAWVRPSTPTPPHLQTFSISLIDQLVPNSQHVPAVFYYDHDEARHPSVAQKLQLLKTSLSEILPRFYPLAGRIKTDLVIDCTDEGVRYREARVNRDLKQFMDGSYDLSQIMHFHPLKHIFAREGTHVANVQVTEFQCGGLAIGVCICHMIADGVGFSVFMKAWAAAARGCMTGDDVILPNFNSVSVFPAHDTWVSEMSNPTFEGRARNGNYVTRKFTFDSAAITELRELATGAGWSRRATRVEAISALLWKCIMDVISEPESDPMMITSWCKFGLYEADFGWGKPRWIGYCTLELPMYINLVVLLDARDGEGIEAWVTMDVGVMDMMSANSEFAKFARPTQTEFGQYK